MNWLEHLLSPALVHALGWTLVHSLWQGAVVALALAGLLLLLRRHQATVRYNVSAVALAVLLGLAAVTFARHYYAARFAESNGGGVVAAAATTTPQVLAAPAAAALPAASPAYSVQAWLTYFDQNLPVLVAAWLLGLLAMTLRLLGGLAYVQRLRHYRVQLMAEEWQQRLAALAARSGLRRPVLLLESALVKAPLVVGHLRPLILLPLGTATGLSQLYLEAILAHELAHVARRDYLLNLLQALAETLFFYHPAVWFVSACLRTERENCCDDAATELVGGNPLTLARALATLAELSLAAPATPRLALSAVGPDGSLLGRIRRLVQGRGTPTFSEGFMAACVVLGGLVLLTTAVALADPQPAAGAGPDSGALRRLPFLAAADAAADKAADDTARVPALALEGRVDATADNLRQVELLPNGRVSADINGQVVEFDTTLNRHLRRAWANPANAPRRAGTRRVEVTTHTGPRRSAPSTVILEKDKKGRLTNLYVNGQRVETAATSSKKKNKKATTTEIIRVAPQEWAEAGRFSFDFGNDLARSFRFEGLSGPSAEETARLRRDVQVQVEAARRQARAGQAQRNYSFHFGQDGNGFRLDLSGLEGIESRALAEAEQSLREAERNAKTEDERTRIRQERERLTERRQQLRAAAEEDRRNAEEDRRNAEEDRLNAEEDRRNAAEDRRNAMRDAAEARREALRHDEWRETLIGEMLREGLITDRRNFSFSLSANGLTVNGKKQPAAVFNRYRTLYESRAGRKLSATGTINVTESHSGSSVGAPPAAPAPVLPRAPRAPRALPSPPAPPAPPRIDSGQIRDELRKDGLLGKDEKSFQFQLNDSGLRVNGTLQSAALTEKYRKLLDVPAGAKGRNINISVSE